jgi:hypothetical protein
MNARVPREKDRMDGKIFYLLGGNGAPNFGDELMAKGWIDHLSTAFPEAGIVLDCNSVASPQAYFGPEHPSLEVIAGFKQFCNRVIKDRLGDGGGKPALFLEALRQGAAFFDAGDAERHPELRPALDRLARAASFHIFGGGYINTGIRPDSGFLIGLAAAIARRHAIPVFATGIGITPLNLDGRAGAEDLAAALAAFRLFECRDTYGFDKLFELGGGAEIVSGVDDSFLLRPPVAPRGDAAAPALHLSLLRKPLEGRNAGLYDEIVALAEGFGPIFYWNCVPSLGDRNIELLRRRLPRLEVLDCHALIHAPLPVRPGDYMVTQRFHPHLIAARLGCAGTFVEDGVYYFDKHHSILHLGSGFRKYVPGRLADPEVAGRRRPGEIVARDPETMARKARVRDACYGAALG